MTSSPKRFSSSTRHLFHWPELFLLSLLQVVGMGTVAPLWQSVFTALIVLAKWVIPGLFNRSIKLLLSVLGGVWFFLYYGLSFTVDIAAGFLWLAASLKLLEIQSVRDLKIYLYIMLYVSAVTMLFDQGIGHVIVQLAVIVLALAVLLRVHGGLNPWAASQWRAIAKVIAFALPIVVVLFVFFPRIGPLWTIPVKASTAVTGMSDSMSPGDIADLANSDERVFRVSFSGQRPVQSALYWRGLVLDRFDGRRWSRTPKPFIYGRKGRYDLGRDSFTKGDYYQVLMEPHNQLWLYALEGSKSLSSQVKHKDMGLFELGVEAIQPVSYRMSYSPPEYIGNEIPTAYLLDGTQRRHSPSALDLQVPFSGNPETRRFVSRLRQQFPSDLALINHLLGQFRQQSFAYTLTPPLHGEDFVDEFMFRHQRGFCSHFSSSLTFMLRLAGIPARVVIGYQGGEYVAGQDYLIVREYDAHAWVEASIEGLGWVRVDPTAMVAPDRIERNLEQAVAEEGTFLQGNILAQLRKGMTVVSWLSLKIDQVNYVWQKWVINYSQEEQYAIFKKWLGDYSLTRVALLFVSVFVMISLLLVLRSWFGSDRRALTKPQRRYLRWLQVLSIFGYSRQMGESPKAFLSRVRPSMPSRLYSRSEQETVLLEDSEYR